MKGHPPSGHAGESSDGRGGPFSLLSGIAVLAGVAVTGVSSAAAASRARGSGGRGGGGGGGGGGGRGDSTVAASAGLAVASEEAVAAKMGEVAKAIGEVADSVLKHVSDRMPGLEAWTISTLDTIFAPRLVLRHLMVAVALQTGLLTYNGLVAVASRLLSRLSTRHGEVKAYRHKMRTAKNYEEWRVYAERVDRLEGHDEWRRRPDSLLYNHKVLQQQISDLNAMINAEDVFGLMFRLRGSLSRNQHGMLHEGLFSRAHAGTKVLVERYHEVVCEALHYVCAKNAVAQDIPTDAKLAFFNETRHAYGRTALMLSGGAAMGVYHTGVVKALLERRLLPRVISGASAGSIVAAMVGTRTDAELRPMFEGHGVNLEFFQPLRRCLKKTSGDDKYKNSAFWQLLVPPGLRWMGTRLWNVLLYSEGFLKMDTDFFRNVLRHNIGSFTFQEAFDRTGRIVNITVAPKNRTDPPRLLNYLTAPHVLVWSAAVCSSSVPGVFEPSILLVKDADGSTHPESGPIEKFVDGSMEADLPMQQISELFNINHFIVSQVNPHATLLSTMALSKSVWSSPTYSFLVGIVGFLQTQVRNWFRNMIEFVSHRRLAPVWASKRGGIQLLTQEYEGRHCDVTITPWKGEENMLSSFAKMLKNVNNEEFRVMTIVAERNTWPKVEMIRSHCAVEMCLEQCVQSLRRQLTTENQLTAESQMRRLMPTSRHPSSEDLNRGGRVSSFYTSRSIVNLSGLSVTDPSVVMEQQPHQLPSPSRATFGSDSAIEEEDRDGDGDEDEDGHNNGDVGLDYLQDPQHAAKSNGAHAALPGGDLNGGDASSSPHPGAGWKSQPAWGRGGKYEKLGRATNRVMSIDPIARAEMDAAGGVVAAAAAAGYRIHGDLAEDQGASGSAMCATDLGWLSKDQLAEMGLAPKEDVVKSTSMANFYYRRSQSLEASMNEMRQSSASSGNLSTRSDPSFVRSLSER